MTFDFTAAQDDWSRRARDFAQHIVAPLAQQIDESGAVPEGVRSGLSARAISNPFADDVVSGVAVIEEVAVESAGVATAVGLQWAEPQKQEETLQKQEERSTKQESAGMPGLRGSNVPAGALPADAHRERLVLCAVALGVGRAAVAIAVGAMKARGIRPSGEEPTPHWTLADAAAELDAARLLVLSAAQTIDRREPAESEISMAARLSAVAAERAVEAASLVVGAKDYRRGSPLERLTRDARTLKLLLL